DGANFEGLSANSALFRKDQKSREVAFNGPTRFYAATVSSNLEADDSRFNSTANLENMTIKGHALFRRTVFARDASFASSTVGRTFDLSKAQFNNSRFWINLDDVNADVIDFQDTVVKNHILVSGFTFREVGLDGLNNVGAIISRAEYDAGAYAQLEDYYRRRGNTYQANQIYISRRRRERSKLPFGIEWLWSLVLDGFVGYGRRPEQVIIPSAIVLAFGCYVFRNKSVMEAQDAQYQLRH